MLDSHEPGISVNQNNLNSTYVNVGISDIYLSTFTGLNIILYDNRCNPFLRSRMTKYKI